MRVRVITPIYNECELLPGFLRHYEKIADSILIWDNGSTDGSLEIAKAHPLVELRNFKTESYDALSVLGVLSQSKAESEDYDWCLFPDCDEILTVQDGGDLRAHLEEADPQYDVIRAVGYTLVKHASEAPFDGRKEWLGQRKFGFADRMYSKPIILKPWSPATFAAGNHNVIADPKVDPEEEFKIKSDAAIALIHFEMVDFCLWHYRKTRRPISEENKSRGWTPRFCREAPAYHRMWSEALAKSRFLDREVPALKGRR